MEVENILAFVYEVAKINGGYLTIREAAKKCDIHFGQLLDNSEMKTKENNSNNNTRKDSCCSDCSGSSSGNGCCGSNNNTKSNDRAEFIEKKLKSFIKSSDLFKLNGNVLFVSSKTQSKTHITNKTHLKELRRNSLPELDSDHELVTKICQDLESKQEQSDSISNLMTGISSMKSSAIKSVTNFKVFMAKYPSHFSVRGNNVQLLNKSATRSTNKCHDHLSKSLETSNEMEKNGSKIPRSHSLDHCDDISDDQLSSYKPSHEGFPPSYLATPSMFHCLPGSIPWPDMEYFSKKYKNSDRLVAIMKNFETDVQMATERLIKQMRSELDSMLVELHRPANKNLGEGTVFCVQKKWGIIDLGNHDHVFFDMSIMLGNVDDLRNHFKVGEVLGFEAVRAQKSSRANWRAIRVWKVDKIDDESSVKIENMQHNEDLIMNQGIQNKAFNRLCESGTSSRGYSSDASCGTNKWKTKQTNPLSRAVVQDDSSTSTDKSVSYPKMPGSSSAWGHIPLFQKTPFQINEVRLLPSRILTPPGMKNIINTPTCDLKSLNKNNSEILNNNKDTKSPNNNNLQILNSIQALRDSGTESGNSSPDAAHKNLTGLKPIINENSTGLEPQFEQFEQCLLSNRFE